MKMQRPQAREEVVNCKNTNSELQKILTKIILLCTRRNSKIAKLQKWKIEKVFLFCCQPFNNENADQKHRNIATKIIEFKFAKCNKIEVLNTKQKTQNCKNTKYYRAKYLCVAVRGCVTNENAETTSRRESGCLFTQEEKNQAVLF